MFKCSDVQVAVWLATAIMTYEKSNDCDVTKEECFFKQAEIQKKAQMFCTNKIVSARIGQWFNGDHSNNTYNFLRASGSLRRLTLNGEFNGVKEYPLNISKYIEECVETYSEGKISVKDLFLWSRELDVPPKIFDTHNIQGSVNVTTGFEKSSSVEVEELDGEVLKAEISIPETSFDLGGKIQHFMDTYKFMGIEVYNEFSLQHELGIYLRQHLPKRFKVQFERNVSYFGLNKTDFTKREIDIVIYDIELKEKYAIELKAPRNGEVPEQMYGMIKDIKFLEELRCAGFSRCYQLTLVDNHLFFKGPKSTSNGIYSYFRDGKDLKGKIMKPTGNTNYSMNIDGLYRIEWNELSKNEWYFCLEV